MERNTGFQLMTIFRRAALTWKRCQVIQLWTYLHNPPGEASHRRLVKEQMLIVLLKVYPILCKHRIHYF